VGTAERTPAAGGLADRQSADFVGPDLVATLGGVPIARHEPGIAGTPDAATRPEFAARGTTRVIDGRRFAGASPGASRARTSRH
jgi:glycerophosphoryl diester phosphodiesterase